MVQGLIGAIIYEDPRLLVIDNPVRIAVHGGSGVSFGVIEGARRAPTRPSSWFTASIATPAAAADLAQARGTARCTR